MGLPHFSEINEIVSIRPPSSTPASLLEGPQASLSNRAEGRAAPQTILLLSWSDASLRHIEKYTTLYSAIWPGAEIILVRTGMVDFFYRTEETSRRLVRPVIEKLSRKAEESLLVHVMSNAGSKQWCTIDKSYSQSTGSSLSSATTIIDSAPGRARFKQTWGAMAGSLPKAFLPRTALSFIFGVVLVVIHAAKFLFPGPDVIDVIRAQMNNSTEAAHGTRRCYIYSELDEIVGWQDVEEHAKDAENKGWAVDLVKFAGSSHVGHFKQDPTKYREAIERTWYGDSL